MISRLLCKLGWHRMAKARRPHSKWVCIRVFVKPTYENDWHREGCDYHEFR